MKMFVINVLCFISYFILWYVGIYLFFRFSKKEYSTFFKEKKNFIDMIFDFVKIKAYDSRHYDKDTFKPHGIVMYEGIQGSGKTMCMVFDTLSMLDKYPKSKCIGNLGTIYRRRSIDELKNWRELVTYNNGIYGVIVQIDEMQTWAYSRDFKNADPNILGLVCQNRKNRRIILGTAQKFTLVDKTIRLQVNELRSCFTIAGCISGYIRKQPLMDVEGNVLKYKFKGLKLFVQTTELRECYDTYKVIEKFKDSGFVEKKRLEVL